MTSDPTSIATIRKQVVELRDQANEQFKAIESLRREIGDVTILGQKVDELRHHQQSLRGAIMATLDNIDRMSPPGNVRG